jgi:hypothetical protein
MPIESLLRSLLLPVTLVMPLTEALSAQSVAPEPSAQHTTIAIRAGRLLDVESGRMSTDQVILVRDGRIQAVGPNLKVPEDASLIDLSKQTVLPGLIDCHTHLADLADSEPLSLLRKSAVETAYAAIPNARLTLMAGFTTVRDVGVYRAFNDVAMRDAIARGIIVGPRGCAGWRRPWARHAERLATTCLAGTARCAPGRRVAAGRGYRDFRLGP